MLTELKYNFVLTSSAYRYVWPWVQFGLVVLLVTLSVDTLWVWLLSAMVLAAIIRPYQSQPVKTTFVTLSENGEWLERKASETEDTERWVLDNRSRLTPFALFVMLQDLHTKKGRYQWIWPDQLDDRHYRRLARVIYRQGLN